MLFYVVQVRRGRRKRQNATNFKLFLSLDIYLATMLLRAAAPSTILALQAVEPLQEHLSDDAKIPWLHYLQNLLLQATLLIFLLGVAWMDRVRIMLNLEDVPWAVVEVRLGRHLRRMGC